MLEPRVILHFDLDAFFAAVEVLLDSTLKGRPVVVGADPHERGVVATASYEARAFGIHSAMPIRQAYLLCPDGVYLRPRHDLYREHSRGVFAVVGRFSRLIEQVSIDEAFVLLEGSDPIVEARALKSAIREETGLVASVGVASSKLVAKVASDEGKPDGFLVVSAGQEAGFLAPLPARRLWGIGPRTAERLERLGIETIGDLARADPRALVTAVGPNLAAELQSRARAEDSRPLETAREPKSISDETTFQRDEADRRRLWQTLSAQCETCARRLHAEGLLARTVTLKLRYSDFATVTRSITFAVPTDNPSVIAEAVVALVRHHWSTSPRPLRLVGVRVSGLERSSDLRQLPLFRSADRH